LRALPSRAGSDRLLIHGGASYHALVLSLHRTASVVVAITLTLGPARLVAAAPDSNFSSDRARELYERGVQKFDQLDYEGALEELDASLAVERTTPALYAKAQALNKLGRCGDAVPVYDEVLEAVPPKSTAASAVKDALVTCAEKLAADRAEADQLPAEPEPEPVSDPEPESDPHRDGPAWYRDVPAPILLGVGMVGVGVGAGLLGQAASLDPENADDYGAFESERDQQHSRRIAGGVILGVGGALLVGGVVRYILVARKNDAQRSPAALTPSFGPHQAGLTIRGRF